MIVTVVFILDVELVFIKVIIKLTFKKNTLQ